MNLKNPEFRKQFIDEMGSIIDSYVAAYRITMESDEMFRAAANFPAELIPHTTNGYQRFLSEQQQSDNRASELAGFLINLCAQLKYTFGTELLGELQTEIFGVNVPIQSPDDRNRNSLSLWALAFQGDADYIPPSTYNALVTYLFLHRVRWLMIRTKLAEKE